MTNITETTNFINSTIQGFKPKVGIILGTGLGQLVDKIDVLFSISYADIPHFPVSTVESHSGKLIFGKLSGVPIVCMQGRFHFYEGYSMQEVAYPVRVFKELGIANLFVSNASGGLNLTYKEGDLMLIDDHISLFLPTNPLVGKPLPGDRFPDMSEPYSNSLIQKALDKAAELSIKPIHRGTYVSVTGPQLETKAEYRLLRSAGADAVGMSTVPEVIMARQMGMDVFAVSVITDICDPDNLQIAELSSILASAAKAEPQLTSLIQEMVKEVA